MSVVKSFQRRVTGLCIGLAALTVMVTVTQSTAPCGAQVRSSFSTVVDAVQPKIVKIYGAGGFRRLEAYQSGFLVSGEGHVVTAWTHVLDTDLITVTLNDGSSFEATLLGADPRIDVAVLKIDAEQLPHFRLEEAPTADAGTRVLAFSNLFGVATGDEPASVQHGSISAVTSLAARSGAYKIPYHGTVYVVDAITNNPGAAGGALTNRRGQLVGMLGKEVRNSLTNTWLNYAIPVGAFAPSASGMIAGKLLPTGDPQRTRPPQSLAFGQLGIVLVPNVLARTPPFIDAVRPDSPAEAAGLKPDDLIVFLNGRLVPSCTALQRELEYIEHDATISLTVMREEELIEIVLNSEDEE